jgi:hypothetical protein
MSTRPAENELLLAAEECDQQTFRELHVFTSYEEDILRRLIAHGPVLLKGARGSGKSALLREAAIRLQQSERSDANAIGFYISLRHLPLLTSREREYEEHFYRLLIQEIVRITGYPFNPAPNTAEVQGALTDLSTQLGKRIVLLFDDAAHIGREAPLTEFFDLFRTLSGSRVSCKASIYPGVTNFGTRFDVYNDATVIDLARNEDHAGFSEFFSEIVDRRYGEFFNKDRFASTLSQRDAAGFVGRAVLGNVRAFVFIWNRLLGVSEREPEVRIGLNQLGDTMVEQSREYFWPLIDEVKPKLGKYEPMVLPAKLLAEGLYREAAANNVRSVLILRELVERLTKPFEILEYAGFVARREASRGMKSSGRGTRFVLNLCNLLENMTPTRLTSEVFEKWMERERDPLELHRGARWLREIDTPDLPDRAQLSVLELPIRSLMKSPAYPYGLTEAKVEELLNAGWKTVGDVARAKDEDLDRLWHVGERWIERIRAVIGQAVWM